MVTASEIPIRTVREGVDATDMAETIFGNGVTVVSASYTGDEDSAGIFTVDKNSSLGSTPGRSGVILSTGEAEDYTNSSGEANQSTQTSTNTSGQNNNSEFNTAAGTRTYDASYLDVDFIPENEVMTMQFVFSSEEYPEFQNSIFQDFVGVWVNGQLVEMEIGNGDIDPGNVNETNNTNLYVDNTGDDFNTEMDGFTITLSLTMVVNPNEVNSIRIGIADVSDSSFDSNLMIAANSVQTDLVAITDNVFVNANGSKSFNVLDNDLSPTNSTLTVTHINGQSVSVGSTIQLPTGQTVTLGAGGEFTVTGDGDVEDFNFTYAITDGVNTDTGFVNATSIPCFVAGTRISTPDGDVQVEDLKPGDLVLTQDDGPQALRWVGSRAVAASGDFAPILIRAGTFGRHGDVQVSPLHRVLIRDSLAELLFGEAEVLVAAKDLVNDHSVIRMTGGEVTYVHLMFDKHQVVFSDGLATESFLPGPQTVKSMEAQVVDEICAIFPELDPHTGDGYSPAARRMLKGYEATIWRTAQAAA
ncbi:Hint domain-containing protein [Tateyamaria armeniaca]|uniref:Hint domain-containing protein n=1 Tax=Tateyamaria armeniaca TaxID=2518930 RepID=A0ABW8UTQ9_9RHOB